MGSDSNRYTAFAGTRCLANGPLDAVALACRAQALATPDASLAVFQDATGRRVDLDLRGSEAEVLARLLVAGEPENSSPARRGPGRPRLGVVAREVTLLPRHWDWLGAQRGGASAGIRRLVDEARRRHPCREAARQAHAAVHRFLWDLAGDLPGFEEATRALDAGDDDAFAARMADWPPEVRAYTLQLTAALRTSQAEAEREG